MMIKKIIISALIFLALPLITIYAQWEKLPLYGGHVEKFIKNKFNQNDVFALVKNYGVWYSSDAGENWQTINGNNDELLNRKISDLEITKDGSIYLIIEQPSQSNELWYSSDLGTNWVVSPIPSKYSIGGNVETNIVGNLFLYAVSSQGSSLNYLLKSTDKGVTWFEVPLPSFDNSRFWYYKIDEENDNIIFLYGLFGYYAATQDGGNTWSTTKVFYTYSKIYAPFKVKRGSQFVYALFVALDGWNGFDYCESQDTCKTWVRKNINTIPEGNGDNIITLDNGDMLSPGTDSLMTSTDGGVTWHGSYLRAIDLIKIDNKILGTFLMKGIQKSSDAGLTWNPVQGIPNVCMFSNIKIATATDSIIYVAVSDEDDIYYYPLWQLRFSSDAGNTWKILFESEDLGDLQVTVSDKIRYYCIVDKRNLISGVFYQTLPDTLLKWTLTGNQFPGVEMYSLKKSYLQQGLLYLAANTGQGMKVFHSKNFGKDWESTDGAPFAFKYFHIFPSCVSTGTIIGTSELINDMDLVGRGYWISYDYGLNWTLSVNTSPNHVLGIFDNDLIYDWTTFSHSSDYGRTWYINKDGIKDEVKDNSFSPYTIVDKLLINYDTSWYQYVKDKWKSLPTISGKKLPRGSLQSLSYIGNTFYGGFQGNGLYRFRDVIITDVEYDAATKNDFYLSQNYPNPFKENTIIKFSSPMNKDVDIVITNSIGKIIRRFHISHDDSNEKLITWDGTDENNIKLPSGIYLISILSNKNIISRKATLLK